MAREKVILHSIVTLLLLLLIISVVLIVGTSVASGQVSPVVSPAPETGSTNGQNPAIKSAGLNGSLAAFLNAINNSTQPANAQVYPSNNSTQQPQSGESGSADNPQGTANTTTDATPVIVVTPRLTPTPLPVSTVTPETSGNQSTAVTTTSASPVPSPTATPAPGFGLLLTLAGILVIVAVRK